MVKRVSLGRWVDGTYRLRVSANGYDVDSTTLTKDQIIFDSSLNGYGPVYLSGSFSIGASTYSNALVAAWPDLGYIPNVRIIIRPAATYDSKGYPFRGGIANDASDTVGLRFRITSSGIRLNGVVDTFSYSSMLPFNVYYIVTAHN